MGTKYKTDYLFPDATFFGGMASVIDLAGALFIHDQSETAEEADSKAIFNDWAMIGQDINTANEQQIKQERQ